MSYAEEANNFYEAFGNEKEKINLANTLVNKISIENRSIGASSLLVDRKYFESDSSRNLSSKFSTSYKNEQERQVSDSERVETIIAAKKIDVTNETNEFFRVFGQMGYNMVAKKKSENLVVHTAIYNTSSTEDESFDDEYSSEFDDDIAENDEESLPLLCKNTSVMLPFSDSTRLSDFSKKKKSNNSDINSSCSCCKPVKKSVVDGSAIRDGIKDSSFHEYAYNQTLMEFKVKCRETCVFGRDCVTKCTIAEVTALRESFWGKFNDDSISASVRKEKIEQILRSAWYEHEKKFRFYIGNRETCEFSYLMLLALISNSGTSRPPRQWIEIKDMIQDPKKIELRKLIGVKKADKEMGAKSLHAITFIRFLAKYLSDFSFDDPNVKILPYDSIKQIFDEYDAHYRRLSQRRETHVSEIASIGTLTRAFHYLQKEDKIKLRGCKGSFETCPICNNINDALKSTKLQWTKAQLEIVLRLKRLHLNQQAKERECLESNKKLAREKVDDDRQPMYALIFPDGYTVHKGLTPKIGKRASKGENKFGNRLIGVEVICGPVETFFLYSLKDTVSGGSNMICTLIRAAIEDLSKVLNDHGLRMPKRLFLQFDNCGENKNRVVFAFLALIVERGYFQSIQVNFLIVGHTHASIDQYFSVLTNSQKDIEFIGSPLALRAFYQTCGTTKPLINRELQVIYDFKSWLTPMINSKLKYYQMPHEFLFKRRFGRGICLFKPFSTSPDYYPKEPIISEESILNFDETYGICMTNAVSSFGIIDGGMTALYDNFLEADSSKLTAVTLASNPVYSKKNIEFNHILPQLKVIECKGIAEATIQFEEESESGYLQHAKRFAVAESTLLDVQNEMKLQSNDICGFVLWIDYSKMPIGWKETSPLPYNYFRDEEVMRELKGKVNEIIAINNETAGIYNPLLEESGPQSSQVVAATSKSQKSLFSNIAAIVSASKHVLQAVNDNVFQKSLSSNFNFKEKILNPIEIEFYTQHSTARGVLEEIDRAVQSESQIPFELIPLQRMPEKTKLAIEAMKEQVIIETRQIAERMQSVEAKLKKLDDVSRIMNDRKKKKTKTVQKKPQCDVVDCRIESTGICRGRDCRKNVCDTHKGHVNHKNIVWKTNAVLLEASDALMPLSTTENSSDNEEENLAESNSLSNDGNSIDDDTSDEENNGPEYRCETDFCNLLFKKSCYFCGLRLCDQHLVSDHQSFPKKVYLTCNGNPPKGYVRNDFLETKLQMDYPTRQKWLHRGGTFGKNELNCWYTKHFFDETDYSRDEEGKLISKPSEKCLSPIEGRCPFCEYCFCMDHSDSVAHECEITDLSRIYNNVDDELLCHSCTFSKSFQKNKKKVELTCVNCRHQFCMGHAKKHKDTNKCKNYGFEKHVFSSNDLLVVTAGIEIEKDIGYFPVSSVAVNLYRPENKRSKIDNIVSNSPS